MRGLRGCVLTLTMVAGTVAPLVAGGGDDHRPIWAPDGRAIFFMSNRDGGDWELFRIGTDGRGLERLTRHAGWDGYADISPDGRWLIFDRRDDADGARIIKLDLETGLESTLVRFPDNGGGGRWSPDGRRIAFWMETDGGRDVFLINPDGSGRSRVTDLPEVEHDPVFSPDGSHLMLVVNLQNGTAIDVVRLDGGARRRLATFTGRAYGLAWSPDGRHVALNTDDAGSQDLYLMDADGTNRRALTTGPANDHLPVWSRDGRQLIFTREEQDREHVMTLDVASGRVEAFATRSGPTVREYLANQLEGSGVWRQENPAFSSGNGQPRYWERVVRPGPAPQIVTADAYAVLEGGSCQALAHMVFWWDEAEGVVKTDGYIVGNLRRSGRLVPLDDAWALETDGRTPDGTLLRFRDVPGFTRPDAYSTVGYRWDGQEWVRQDEAIWRQAQRSSC